MIKPISVKPLQDFKLWVKYEDGTEGVTDLSNLKGKGVFQLWNLPGEFEKVFIDDTGALAWNDEIDICPDTVYLELKQEKTNVKN